MKKNVVPASMTGMWETIRDTGFAVRAEEEGVVLSVGDGIARISGLRHARLYELIRLETGDEGLVFDLAADSIGVVLLTDLGRLKAGAAAYKTERIGTIGVGESLLGRVIDALGKPIDGGAAPESTTPYPVEREAPLLIQREFISEPLQTGIKVIDSMLPIGRGQRELIIGDPSTGKSSIAVDAIINQKGSDVISVYTAIGQKKSHVLKVVEELKTYGDFSKTIVVVADASASLGLQYIAPYSATAIAEYFLDKGRSVLLVYDDLTKHADAYRSLSLLLKRPPGREAFPGDIFFIHGRLLERSAKLNDKSGGGSITALPIVETQQGRISSYIPTNLISITDGQIYLDAFLFNKGIRPAVDVGRSVSRIGAKAQVKAMKRVAEKLKIDYSHFADVEAFTKFGAHLDEEAAAFLRRGERLRELLRQPRFHPLLLSAEVLTLLVIDSGALDFVDIASVKTACDEILLKINVENPEAGNRIDLEGMLDDSDVHTIKQIIANWEETSALVDRNR